MYIVHDYGDKKLIMLKKLGHFHPEKDGEPDNLTGTHLEKDGLLVLMIHGRAYKVLTPCKLSLLLVHLEFETQIVRSGNPITVQYTFTV